MPTPSGTSRRTAPPGRSWPQWHGRSGLPLRKFFNTSGQLYKSLALKDRLPGMTEDEQLDLLSSDGMLVKRPILVTETAVLVGFREADWTAALL